MWIPREICEADVKPAAKALPRFTSSSHGEGTRIGAPSAPVTAWNGLLDPARAVLLPGMKMILRCFLLLVPGLAFIAMGKAAEPKDVRGLKDAAVLIIRHAEKPESGPTLSPAGEARAKAIVAYFKNFAVDGKAMRPESLFAAADSKSSHRPRLTLDPLGKALGLKIDGRFNEKLPDDLARELRTRPHGKCVLISWRHGGIPDLLRAFGAEPSTLLPEGKWPDLVFGWVILLRFDHNGRPIPSEARRISEKLMPGD